MATLRIGPYRSNTAHTFWEQRPRKQVRNQHKNSNQLVPPQTQRSSWIYLSNAGGSRPHIFSIYQDVHCVICTPTNAHTASHLDPRFNKDSSVSCLCSHPQPPLPAPVPGASPLVSRGSGHSSSFGGAHHASLHSWTPSRWSLSGVQARKEAALDHCPLQAPCPLVRVWSAPGGGSLPTSRLSLPLLPVRKPTLGGPV